MSVIKKSFQFGDSTVTLESGRVARQASGAVIVTIDDISVLATVVVQKTASQSDFFPLTVHYQEKYYATGRIPGGYNKREGRPSEKETLTSRLIDRPIRPLFPKGFMNEVQVICTVLSANKTTDPDIAAMIATSAALAISGAPFNGPVGAARVGFSDDEGYILNPDYQTLESSRLDMVVAGTRDAVLMVESEAQELDEDQMLGAVLYAHQEMQTVIEAISEFAAEVNTPTIEWVKPEEDTELLTKLQDAFGAQIGDSYQISDKLERQNALASIRDAAAEQFVTEEDDNAKDVAALISKIEKTTVRQRIVNGEPRIDGRDNKTVRSIAVEIDQLANAHGSALFTRGETQALVVATLGSLRDTQMVDLLHGTIKEPFMLHYNFPPYSVGETGRMGGVGRREIGHGRLARRGIAAVLPKEDEFPYTIRVVSEITESNGSSSMASVCGSSLALMDAGVPLKAAVAGVAMGLVKEGDGFAVLTDILGDEDHLGDMDFKVAGTESGVTALQMDIKIEGITEEIMEIALQQAFQARSHILKEMAKVIGYARPEVSDNAPVMKTLSIPQDKIRDVIGKGGATIRGLCEDTGAQVDIDDDGTVRIYADDKPSAMEAEKRIELITAEAEVGLTYKGTVSRVVDFGAFVSILPGKEGLVHISQISSERVESVADHLAVGQEINVKVLDVDARGRIKLTMKDLEQPSKA